MKHLMSVAAFFCISATQAQDTSQVVVSADVFLNIVKLYHPVARQADIAIDNAKAQQLAARGLFDPQITSNVAQKNFDGIRYYNAIDPVLNIPTWYGIELYAGTGYLAGDRLDPTETAGKTSFAGISIPLAKNLLMDKRRAFLKTAAIYRSLSFVEKRTIINDLMLEAATAYWEWAGSYELLKLASEAVLVNENRLKLVKQTVNMGERAAIDTVETLAQLQSFRFLQNDAWVQFVNNGINLQAFLWNADGSPFQLPEKILPAEGQLDRDIDLARTFTLESLIDSVVISHPKLKEFDFKLRALEINRRLKFQELLPVVNLKYNQLGKGYDVLKTAGNFLTGNNYRFGMSFSLPLRLSQGRGEYKMAQLKISETVIEQNFLRQLLLNKVHTSFNDFTNLKKQITLQQEAYNYYLRLQRAEELRYFNGESSLFLINSRETKALEAMQKLIEIKTKYFIAEAKVKNAAAVL